MEKKTEAKREHKAMHEMQSLSKAVKALEANHKGFEKGHCKGKK